MVKKLPSSCREGFRYSPDARVYQRGPSKATRLRRLLILLEIEPSKKKPRIFFSFFKYFIT